VTHSGSGGITSELLAGILQRLDDLNLFQRSKGVPDPCILVDGHGPRFENEFLSYIMDKDHRWEVCLGLPNATHVWQVGDLSQQDGTYKIKSVQAKQELVDQKSFLKEEPKLTRNDIIPITIKVYTRRRLEVWKEISMLLQFEDGTL
jgi:hypothetical protein